jgi:hypothetical protein
MRLALLLLAHALPAHATDPRQCYIDRTQIPRTADGSIKRSTAVRAAFVRLYPCPATGEVSGACRGWAVDHVVPLAVGGCDAVQNLQWLPHAIKSCATATGVQCKDRWEMRVYTRRSVL